MNTEGPLRTAEAARFLSEVLHLKTSTSTLRKRRHQRGSDARDNVTTRDVAEVLGHANRANTKRYSALNAARFRGIWRRHK